MHLVVISHAGLVKNNNGKWTGYAPYIGEIDLWMKYVDKTTFICPTYLSQEILKKEIINQEIQVVSVPSFSLVNMVNTIKAPFLILINVLRIFQGMYFADHIHLRCPGNVGLLGCFIQIFFPWKKKTAKYAGNWDPDSKQPISYKIQKWILNNTVLSKNIKVIVYGEWPNSSKNIIPIFTATYSEEEKIQVTYRSTSNIPTRLLFVGTLHEGKRPLLSIQIAETLCKQNIPVLLHVVGDGPMREELQHYIQEKNLQHIVFLEGNINRNIVKEYFLNAHFLIFLSKSEGWPKVVAEAMWWACLPLTTNVSCVADMLAYGQRGSLIEPTVISGVNAIKYFLANDHVYKQTVRNALRWSRKFTTEKFEDAIANLLVEN